MTTTAAPVPDLGELADVSASLETAPASAIVGWAWDRYGDDLVLAASFQDCVLIDLAVQVAPEIEVVFLDTQYHFAETLWYVEESASGTASTCRSCSPRSRRTTAGSRTPTGAARSARSSRSHAPSTARRPG